MEGTFPTDPSPKRTGGPADRRRGDWWRSYAFASQYALPSRSKRSSSRELGREIRQRHPKLPVVLTSGYSHVLAEEGRRGFELLHKPYAVEEVSRVLRRMARGRG